MRFSSSTLHPQPHPVGDFYFSFFLFLSSKFEEHQSAFFVFIDRVFHEAYNNGNENGKKICRKIILGIELNRR